jgi:hypothetical protein
MTVTNKSLDYCLDFIIADFGLWLVCDSNSEQEDASRLCVNETLWATNYRTSAHYRIFAPNLHECFFLPL